VPYGTVIGWWGSIVLPVAMYAMAVATDSEYAARVAVALKAASYYRGLSTEALSNGLGVPVETVRQWMRGQTMPSAEHLAALTAALDVPGDLLMRPPATRERALAMIAAWDALREDGPRP
jgi:transcriptional regulator with XRE-family HTH domain